MVAYIEDEITKAKKVVKELMNDFEIKQELLLPLCRIYIQGKSDGLELAKKIYNSETKKL